MPSPGDERLVSLFATLAALALHEAQRTEQLRETVSSRDAIGQANGILMERHRINDDAAFASLHVSGSRLHAYGTAV